LSLPLTVLNGPNLNLLGGREPGTYGHATLAEIEENLRATFPEVDFAFFQASGAGALIDRLHAAHAGEAAGVVLNPGGLAHTSIALRDAAAAVALPVVEVHLSNVHAREDFRRRLVVAGACEGVVAGLGPRGYPLAVQHLVEHGSTGSTGARERG
jgi:3-dehydroquinate dehydratase-2